MCHLLVPNNSGIPLAFLDLMPGAYQQVCNVPLLYGTMTALQLGN